LKGFKINSPAPRRDARVFKEISLSHHNVPER